MASEQSISEAVRKAVESKPLPSTIEELDQATRRFFDREATAMGVSPQWLLDQAREIQDEDLRNLNLALGSSDY